MKYSYTTRYKFKLEEDFTIYVGIHGVEIDNRYFCLTADGQLTAKASYCWDGSSIPKSIVISAKILSLGRYDKDRYCKEASLTHDVLCQAMREGKLPVSYKLEIDVFYRNLCIIGGLPKWRAEKRFQALRKFGDSGIKPEEHPRNEIFDTED